MKTSRIWVATACLVAVAAIASPTLASELSKNAAESEPAVLSGLVKQDSGIYFYKDGEAVKRTWKTVKGKTYYFGKSGKAVTGKKKISHYYCYFGSDAILDRKINLNKKLIALTYDDGPSVNTASILKTLKANNSVATFFVVGNRVSSYKDSVKKAAKMGCEIGNHTWAHNTLTSIDNESVKSVVSKTNKAVKKLTGKTPTLLRPPGGATNSRVDSTVGMAQILWSVDTLDWKTQNASNTTSHVLKKAKDGDIVLMHDLYSATAKATEALVPKLVKKGFQLVTVSELADCKGIKLKKNKRYYNLKK